MATIATAVALLAFTVMATLSQACRDTDYFCFMYQPKQCKAARINCKPPALQGCTGFTKEAYEKCPKFCKICGGKMESVSLDNGRVSNELLINPLWLVDKTFQDLPGNNKVEVLIKKVEALLNKRSDKKFVSLKTGYKPHPITSEVEPSQTNYLRFLKFINDTLGKTKDKNWSSFGAYILLSGKEKDPGSTFENWADKEFVPNGQWLSYVKKGSVCSKEQHKKVIMARYVENDDETAKAIAAAIAYFLGIGFDFVPGSKGSSSTSRKANGGPSCSGQGGFMDKSKLLAKANKWTQCSQEDFIKLYADNQLSCLATLPKPPTCFDSISELYCSTYKYETGQKTCVNARINCKPPALPECDARQREAYNGCAKTCNICGGNCRDNTRFAAFCYLYTSPPNTCTPRTRNERIRVKRNCAKTCGYC